MLPELVALLGRWAAKYAHQSATSHAHMHAHAHTPAPASANVQTQEVTPSFVDTHAHAHAYAHTHAEFSVTYAGGVRSLEDLELVRQLGGGRVDVSVGSALDLFGGALAYAHVLAWHRALQPTK